ncbi:MAG: AAA family ATPase [candidate division Zixibacteria bacterium]|nr:AAA family ATPase [candidate division Zixibacteria bacterium]
MNNGTKILVITDSDQLLNRIKNIIAPLSAEVFNVSEPAEAIRIIDSEHPGIVILSYSELIPTGALIRKVLGSSPSIEIIGFNLRESSPELLLNISIEEDPEMSRLRIGKAINDRRALEECGFTGKSHAIKGVANSIISSAPTDLSVLVTGPSGVGKELTARAIHNKSNRADKKFLSINCGALTEGVLSSELFGHEKGAFTGAVARKQGVFETAGEGTIFLDEIGEISAETQVKLLRVLEDGSFYRVGGTEMLKSRARVITATNRDLLAEVSDGNFREDLYYRLRVVEISIPPLSERPEDIPPLMEKFITGLGYSYRDAVDPEVVEVMKRFDWHGNVREMRNFIESRLALSSEGVITRRDIDDYISQTGYQRRNLPVSTGRTTQAAEYQVMLQALIGLREEVASLRKLIEDNLPQSQNYEVRNGEIVAEWHNGSVPVPQKIKSMPEMEKETIASALHRFGGNRRKAAAALGIGERTLYRKIAKYGLENL